MQSQGYNNRLKTKGPSVFKYICVAGGSLLVFVSIQVGLDYAVLQKLGKDQPVNIEQLGPLIVATMIVKVGILASVAMFLFFAVIAGWRFFFCEKGTKKGPESGKGSRKGLVQ